MQLRREHAGFVAVLTNFPERPFAQLLLKQIRAAVAHAVSKIPGSKFHDPAKRISEAHSSEERILWVHGPPTTGDFVARCTCVPLVLETPSRDA